jgi:hypothetical protein
VTVTERMTGPRPVTIIPDSPAFVVGQEVIISDRLEGYDWRVLAPGWVGQRCVVTEVTPSGIIHFTWQDGQHVWQLDPQYLDPAPPADAELRVGQRIEIVGPHEFMHGLSDDWYGETLIELIEDAPHCERSVSHTHITFRRAGVTYVVDREAVRVVGAAAGLDPDIFAIGEEVEIVGPEKALDAVSSLADHIGRVGVIISVRAVERRSPSGYWQRVRLHGVGAEFWYPTSNIRRAGAVVESLSFDAAWRLARSGQGLNSLMEQLWDPISKPVESLSRIKGDWNQLLIARAVLRLRRQFPNSVEEHLVKGRPYTSSHLWSRVWTAATQTRSN